MTKQDNIDFEEKQYLGYNKFSLIRRTVIAIFCFFTYYASEEVDVVPETNTSELLFFMGIIIMVISILLVFVLHIHTKVVNNSLIIDGLWTSRRVKIDIGSIKSVKKVPYSKYLFNRPVYNLHRKGKIKFFTRGNDALEIIDRDGQIYLLGTQKASELLSILEKKINI